MIEKCKKILKDKIPNKLGAEAKLAIVTSLVIALVTAVTVITLRKNVTINVDGEEQTFVTYKNTIEDILQENGIVVNEKDKVNPQLDEKAKDKSTINIKRAVEVDLVANNKTLKIMTAEDTLEDMLNAEDGYLKSEGIDFQEGVDEITPDLSSKIDDNTKITIIKVESVNEVASEPIKFDTITEEDANLDYGIVEVRQAGVLGEQQVTYRVVKKDGKEVSREKISTKIIKESVNEILAEGTARAVATRSGMQRYKDVIYCQATAYCTGTVTATGIPPVYNPDGLSTIAVDPRVIPLGSLVYVEGYGEAIAADTGGAIKGNIIDVYVNSYDSATYMGKNLKKNSYMEMCN